MKKKIPDPNKMKKINGPKISREHLISAKIRVTTYLDADILETLREMADGSGGKYQTLLNQILRQTLIGDTPTLIKRIEKLEEEVFEKKKAA